MHIDCMRWSIIISIHRNLLYVVLTHDMTS